MKYVMSRFAQAVAIVWAAYTLSFVILYALPTNPVGLIADSAALGGTGDLTKADIASLKAKYGFNHPLIVQYWDHLWALLHANLGTSVQTGQSVLSQILAAMLPTIELALCAICLGVTGGFILAMYANYTNRRIMQRFLRSLPSIAVSMPSFLIALVLLKIFAFRIHAFPPFGANGFKSLVLPAIALATPTGAVIAQLFDRSLQDALNGPYITTAMAKGAGPLTVYARHALRNAVLPTLTYAGLLVGLVFGDAILVEVVFARPGIGRLLETAVANADIPLVDGVIVFAAAAYALSTLIVDLLSAWIDPRIGESMGLTRSATSTDHISLDEAVR